jgi:hypothetical protein
MTSELYDSLSVFRNKKVRESDIDKDNQVQTQTQNSSKSGTIYSCVAKQLNNKSD